MSLECGECEQDLRIGHAMDCSRRKNPAQDVSDAALAHAFRANQSNCNSEQAIWIQRVWTDATRIGDTPLRARELQQAQACDAGGRWPCNLPAEHAGPHRTDKSALQQAQAVEYPEEEPNLLWDDNGLQQAQVVGTGRQNDAAIAAAYWEISDRAFGTEGDEWIFPVLQMISDRANESTTPQSSAPVVGRRRNAAIEAAAKAIYEQWANDPNYVAWLDGGNSLKQDEARKIAESALTGRGNG